MKRLVLTWAVLLIASGVVACSTPMTTRETGAAIGAVGGAAAGGIIGSAVGHPGAGAAIGGTLGLGAGALIGDQIQSLQRRRPTWNVSSGRPRRSSTASGKSWIGSGSNRENIKSSELCV